MLPFPIFHTTLALIVCLNFSSTNKFEVQLSRDVSSQLKRFLQEQKSSTVIINIINNHIQIDVHDGPGRTQAQVRATAGGLLGEATRNGEYAINFFTSI